jgi:methyl-accepting chemotaxis protein-1 (serine sensor receptor)
MSMPGSPTTTASVGHSSAWQHVREYFAYHGVWAVGVRALRRWSLRLKMALLVTVMAMPMVPLMIQQVMERNASVHENIHRILGLQVARQASALSILLDKQQQRLESGLPGTNDGEAAALAGLQTSVQRAINHGLPLTDVLQAQQSALDRATNGSSQSTPAKLEALANGLHALRNVRVAAIDQSLLLLTRDAGLAAESTLAALYLPALREEVAKLRSLSVRQAAMMEASPRSATDLHTMAVSIAGTAETASRLLMLCERALGQSKGGKQAGNDSPLAHTGALLGKVRATMLPIEPTTDVLVIRQHAVQALEQIDALTTALQASVDRQFLDLQQGAEAQRNGLYVALALSSVLAVYMIYSFFLVMRGGLDKLSSQMDHMAQGDLSSRPQALGGDEVADTLRSMNTSLARLSDLLASVRQGVGAITQAAQQIAKGNTDLSARSGRSAEGLNELVASVMRYSEQLQACSRMVESVVTTVQALRLASVRNRKQMARLQDRMASLKVKSREINQVVGLIDSIAFRTNILALNAQVEACKAGEAGRGFAVVAQEVRALATRSADSARRVNDIVTASNLEIEQSSALADETSDSIHAADVHVDAIYGAMSSVAELTKKGDQESSAILAEVTVLKDTTAKNLALVEQLAVASDALRGQGERLSHKVGLFKLS